MPFSTVTLRIFPWGTSALPYPARGAGFLKLLVQFFKNGKKVSSGVRVFRVRRGLVFKKTALHSKEHGRYFFASRATVQRRQRGGPRSR